MSAAAPHDRTAQELLETLTQSLEILQASVPRSQFEPRSLQQQFLAAQQLYQQQLMPTLITVPNAEKLVPYQTEINRSLRLLGMDVTFLQSAKNPVTQQKRKAQMLNRLRSLLEFTQGLQAELAHNYE